MIPHEPDEQREFYVGKASTTWTVNCSLCRKPLDTHSQDLCEVALGSRLLAIEENLKWDNRIIWILVISALMVAIRTIVLL